MFTGQASSHALHDVQANTSSEVIRSNTRSELSVISASTDTGGDTATGAVRAATSPSLRTISRGSSGLPVGLAGQTEVQRPHTVQASVSSSCFQVNSATRAAPTVSMSVASIRLGISRMAPLGRSRGARYMLAGEVTMWRSLVVGSITRNTPKAAAWAIHSTWWTPAAVVAGTRLLSGYPTKDHVSNDGLPSSRMRAASTARPLIPMSARTSRIHRSSGLVLLRIRHGGNP